MADEELTPDVPPKPSLFPAFLEVFCSISGTHRRFAAGTESGFAVSLINRKLGNESKPFALYIEAVKDGEEPVAFGPNSMLVDYGSGWKLQTVVDNAGYGRGEGFRHPAAQTHPVKPGRSRVEITQKPPISLLYVSKILLAFVFIFVLGSIFVLALQYLPALILYMNSFM